MTGEEGGRGVIHYSLYHNNEADYAFDALYCNQQGRRGRFFTTDIDEFKGGLDNIKVMGDEAPLIALDSCLDFPWRKASESHRIVIFLTDEPYETSSNPEKDKALLGELQQKTQDLRVLLFIVAPESQVFEELAEIDKSEYEAVDSRSAGLVDVDFRKLLSGIGKSVSVSTANQQVSTVEKRVKRGLFGQTEWGRLEGELDTSDRT